VLLILGSLRCRYCKLNEAVIRPNGNLLCLDDHVHVVTDHSESVAWTRSTSPFQRDVSCAIDTRRRKQIFPGRKRAFGSPPRTRYNTDSASKKQQRTTTASVGHLLDGMLTGQVVWSTINAMAENTYNIHEAKAQFSKLVRMVEQGQEILIARDGTVIARLVPELRRAKIQLGRDAGKIVIADDFDEPLEDFEGYQ
jgi:prevent-host-death family protein